MNDYRFSSSIKWPRRKNAVLDQTVLAQHGRDRLIREQEVTTKRSCVDVRLHSDWFTFDQWCIVILRRLSNALDAFALIMLVVGKRWFIPRLMT